MRTLATAIGALAVGSFTYNAATVNTPVTTPQLPHFKTRKEHLK